MENLRWEINSTIDNNKVNKLKKELKIPYINAKLLVDRGVDTFNKAKTFFKPQLSDLHNPFLMEDMDIAIDRINKAIKNKERVLVYGDYDVDGTTSVALVYSYLKKYINEIDYYQPDRYTEGYGVSFKGIEFAKDNDFNLIIALDCGTKAVDKVKKANEYGIDFIIADHHTPDNELPKAKAILNPKKNTCNYPYKELCGCGIGFKLMQALAIKNNYNKSEVLELIDLVAIAIGADIVPITDENRVLAYFGLKQIENNKRVGIKSILELSNKKGKITISDLVFTLAPRINAAGRIDTARSAVELLLSNNDKEAKYWGDIINKYNDERKEIDKNITAEALKMIEDNIELRNNKSTVVSSSSWHKGVVGIVASRLIEKYYKPTIVLVEKNGLATGSVRSVRGFNVYEAINKCSDLLQNFGGHKYAAGLTIEISNLEKFKHKFENVVKNSITLEQETPTIKIDGELQPKDFELDEQNFPKFYRIIKRMAPFGPQNMKPIFVMKNLHNTGFSKIVGDEHLKLSLKHNDFNITFNGIGFNLGHKINLLKDNKPIDIVFQIDENDFFGYPEIQFLVKDIRESNNNTI